MWPQRTFDLPIFGIDAVVVNNKLQFFISDPSPVTLDGSLPTVMRDAAAMLEAGFTTSCKRADVPEWGKAIFSDTVLTTRPETQLDWELVVMYTVAMARAHLLRAKRLDPLDSSKDAARLAEIDTCHRRCASGPALPLTLQVPALLLLVSLPVLAPRCVASPADFDACVGRCYARSLSLQRAVKCCDQAVSSDL